MRELTEYERQKWFDEYSRFEMDEDSFLSYSNELGEAFIAALTCTGMGSYGLSDEFVKAAEIEVLDMYYYQFHLYTGAYGGYDAPEDLGLPSKELMRAKMIELGADKVPMLSAHYEDSVRKAWDWAMDWREEHKEETYERQRIERLKSELARLEEGHGRNA